MLSSGFQNTALPLRSIPRYSTVMATLRELDNQGPYSGAKDPEPSLAAATLQVCFESYEMLSNGFVTAHLTVLRVRPCMAFKARG
jgi:hypothetical protein